MKKIKEITTLILLLMTSIGFNQSKEKKKLWHKSINYTIGTQANGDLRYDLSFSKNKGDLYYSFGIYGSTNFSPKAFYFENPLLFVTIPESNSFLGLKKLNDAKSGAIGLSIKGTQIAPINEINVKIFTQLFLGYQSINSTASIHKYTFDSTSINPDGNFHYPKREELINKRIFNEDQLQIGTKVGLGYDYYFSKHWGIEIEFNAIVMGNIKLNSIETLLNNKHEEFLDFDPPTHNNFDALLGAAIGVNYRF